MVTGRDLRLARGGRVVLEATELDLPAGVTSLVGPNGSGKSTLLHAVAGLLPLRGGSLRVLDAPPGSDPRRVAYVLQAQHAPGHLPVSVREVVALGRAGHRGALGRLRRSDRAVVASAMDRLELGPLAHRHLRELSGGQRQRAFVAQGLAQEAELLLLDEPLAGLDLASSERIRQVLHEEAAAGRSVVVATHDLADASVGDHVVLLAGRVVASGPPAAVLVRDHIRAAYRGRLLDLGEDTVLVDDAHHHEHV